MSSGVHDRPIVSFSTSGDTLTIHDEIEERSLSITADRPISTQSALTALFQFPVDRAISFAAEELTIGADASAWFRDETGDILTDIADEEQSFSRGTYYLDIDGGVKTYIRLPDVEPTLAYEGKAYVTELSVDLGTETTVTVGARSLHSRPGSAITVPDDPAAMMEAFSYLGSSIKEFSPERSWPTLRGHPPHITRGAELDIPDTLEKPDTGITVTVPETYADLYRVAPLAFYFGATIEPGDDPAMHLPNGYTDQDWAGDAAVNVYFLADVDAITERLGDRGYRVAQLEAAMAGGRLYLGTYAHRGLGGTGLTFYDDEVTSFFEPRAKGQTPMFLYVFGEAA